VNKQFGRTVSAVALVFILCAFQTNALADSLADQLTHFRIETNDCPDAGCGNFIGASEQQIADFLADDAQRRAAARAMREASSSGGAKKKNGQGLGLGKRNNDAQVVYLDFAGPPAFLVDDQFGLFGEPELVALPAYVYSQAEKDEIQARMEADYEQLNYRFTQSPPGSGDFTTITFYCLDQPCITITPTGGVSILFGRADNIDWRNKNRSDNAFADANFWQFAFLIDPSGGFLSGVTGLPIDPDDPTAALSTAVVNQSANTGAHELGHIIGQRHHDSFGAPGDGLPPSGVPNPAEFFPIFPGDQDAGETFLHLMASGASTGLTLAGSANRDRFFSERATVKNGTAARGRLISEAAATGNSGRVKLHNLVVSNPVLVGENADGRLDVDSITIQGFLDRPGFPNELNDPEVDRYRFRGEAGRFFNAEVISFSDGGVTNPVIGGLTLYYVEGDGSLAPVAANLQTFEPFDPLILDFPLPFDGDYVLEFTAPNLILFPGAAPGEFLSFPLDQTGNAGLRTGDYELLLYIVEGALGSGPKRIPGPRS